MLELQKIGSELKGKRYQACCFKNNLKNDEFDALFAPCLLFE